jgi:tetratricopeptide (TPR) repeat protein
LLASSAIAVGCTPQERPGQATRASSETGAPATADSAAAAAAAVRVVEVEIRAPSPAGRWKWEAETSGLLTVLVELGLSDLSGTVPRVAGQEASPGLRGWPWGAAPRWTLDLALGADPRDLAVTSKLCDPEGDCSEKEARGTREQPFQAAAELLDWMAGRLRRQRPPESAEQWPRPISEDDYAILLCGRAAAILYGLLPKVAEAERGDKRKDPQTRAVFVDPGMPHAWWVLARQELAQNEPAAARTHFARASVLRPWSPVFGADEAAAQGALGPEKVDAAFSAWSLLGERLGAEPRFALPRARAALLANFPDAVLQALDSLSPSYRGLPAALELRVAAVEAVGPGDDYDELLRRWQDAAPGELEPVRKRIALRVRKGRLEEALSLAAELERRGAAVEAARLRMALATGLGDWTQAADAAAALGLRGVEARIRARQVLSGDPEAVVKTLAEEVDPLAVVARGEALLRAQRPREALQDAERARKAAPWLPEALELQADTLAALGRKKEAASVRAELARVEPEARAWGRPVQGANTAPGRTRAGSQEQSATP